MSGKPDKALKAALKEGGKKGQDLAGMSAMGGVKFFSVAIESANGKWELMDAVLEGMNKKVDEAAEERKGGADDIGKCLLFADENNLLILCHVPEELKDAIDQEEWFGKVVGSVGGEIMEKKSYEGEGKGMLMKAVLAKDEEKQIFPLKQRDVAINHSFEYLVSKQLVRPDESDDDVNYAEDAGIEW